MTAPELSVVVPTLNEAANVGILLREVRGVFDRLGIRTEFVVVDGASTDGTAQAAAREGARVVAQKEKGLGNAMREGFSAARGDWILTMDADFSHPPSFVERLWAAREGADLVAASRYVPGAGFEAPWARRVLSRILNTLFSRLLRLPARDVSGNFRLYRTEVLRKVRLEAVHFEITEEALVKVFLAGGRVVEVPFHYAPRAGGQSKARVVHFGLRLLATLGRLWVLKWSAS
jgi:glycosyltransferase involved in cell wall biosynthesis